MACRGQGRPGATRRWAGVVAAALACALAPARAADVVRPADVLAFCPPRDLAAKAPPVGLGFRVGSDGAVDLGEHGRVTVAGLTTAQAEAAIEKQLRQPAASAHPVTLCVAPANQPLPGPAPAPPPGGPVQVVVYPAPRPADPVPERPAPLVVQPGGQPTAHVLGVTACALPAPAASRSPPAPAAHILDVTACAR